MILICGVTFLNAQVAGNLATLNDDGTTETLGEQGARYVDYVIPANTSKEYLYFTARGGDGGDCDFEGQPKGGEGATAHAWFKIGLGSGELPPGSTLRFFIGEKGGTHNRNGDGGGGTGILLKKQDAEAWAILLVAGGGGGGHIYWSTNKDGKPGNKSTHGSDGGLGNGDPVNVGGHDGHSSSYYMKASGQYCQGGNGALSNWKKDPDNSDYMSEDAVANSYHNGFYQATPVNRGNGGGFGFGSGKDSDSGGGGGGGYSGGGSGDAGKGGGGGSYVNDAWAIESIIIKNDATNHPKDGYAQFQFLDQLQIPKAFIRPAGHTSKVIDASDNHEGGNITVQSYQPNDNQGWFFEAESYQIRLFADPNRCIDLSGGHSGNGSGLQTWPCGTTSNQKWIYDGARKALRWTQNLGKCIALNSNNASNANNGDQLDLWDCDYNLAQQWNIDGLRYPAVENADHILKIRLANDHDSKCVTLKQGILSNGTDIIATACNSSSTSQMWVFDGDYIKLEKNRNKCLDIKSKSTSNGTNIQLYDCNDGWNQKWVFDGVNNLMRSRDHLDKCLSLNRDDSTNPNTIELRDCSTNDPDQLWYLREPVGMY